MQPTLEDLILFAREAGDILREHFGHVHHIGYKGPIDLVTEADHRSDKFLIDTIQHRFPGDPIITEESGQLGGQTQNCWYIDPLDGTVNYAHRIPIFCVSIAYADQEGPRLGVVYDPTRDECFSAERGQGARLGDQIITPSTVSDLLHSLLVTGFPYVMDSGPKNNLDNFVRLSRLTQGVRRLGSAALDLCYVASGRLDGYWEVGLSPWDIAAGMLIASEAGAKATNLAGSPDYLQPPFSVLVANPALHPLILENLTQ